MASVRVSRSLRTGLSQSFVWSRCSRMPWTGRQYHSYEHETAPPFPPTENAILSAGLAHVPTQGFSIDALACGARDVGYRDVSVNLFPAGAFALIQYHLVTQRLALGESNRLGVDHDRGVAANIKNLALKRLHANRAIIHRWQEVSPINHIYRARSNYHQALALMAMPSHLSTSLRELALLCDEILFQARDTSVNTSWYTKRAALSGIYASTELFMTTDKSPDFVETEAFLERRLEESSSLGSALRDSGEWLGVQAMGMVNGLRSKGVRI